MSFTPILWSVLSVRLEDDGEGDKIQVFQSHARRFPGCLLRQKRNSSEQRLEDGTHNSQGPGLQTKYRRIVSFPAPFPPLIAQNLLLHPDGTVYTIRDLRPYDWTLQVDVEVLK